MLYTSSEEWELLSSEGSDQNTVLSLPYLAQDKGDHSEAEFLYCNLPLPSAEFKYLYKFKLFFDCGQYKGILGLNRFNEFTLSWV